MTRQERDTWTAQEKYRFRTVEAKRYRPSHQALVPRSLVDLLVAEHPSYDGGIRQIDLKLSIDHTLETLKPREERVVRRVFGLNEAPCTYAQIAKDFGVSDTRIMEIYHQALRKLRHPARRKHLQDFVVAV
jgi:DNA-directed RNA polymerase sigma subunit (sigma70/sigma32)